MAKVMDLSKCGGVCKGSCKHYEIGVECPPEATFEQVKGKPLTLADVKEWMQITEGKGGIGRRDLMEWLIAEVERREELAEKYRLEMIRCGKGWEDEIAEVKRLQVKHDACHAELVAIHAITMCIADCPPHQDDDTLTVKGVKNMAYLVRLAEEQLAEERLKAKQL